MQGLMDARPIETEMPAGATRPTAGRPRYPHAALAGPLALGAARRTGGGRSFAKWCKPPRFLGRPLVLALAVGLSAAALTALCLGELSRQQREAFRSVQHTLEVLGKAATLDADLATVASEGRGFVADRTADSVARFDAAVSRVADDLASLRALTVDNPAQQAALAALGPLITARVGVLRNVIERLRAGDEEGGARVMRTQRGRGLMDQISAIAGNVKAEEKRLLVLRTEAARRAGQLALGGLIACGTLLAASATVVTVLLTGRKREREYLSHLRQLNAGLEERVRARTAELATSEARLHAYVHHLADGLLAIRVEPDGRFVYEEVNAAARAMLGIGEDAIGRDIREVWPDSEAEAIAARLRQCVSDRAPLHYGVTRETAEGRRELRVVLTPSEVAPEERVALLLASVRDVTHEVALEAQLRQRQRLEAVGQLTAGIAHDFNNLLQAILGSLQTLREQPSLGKLARECVALAEQAGWRGATLTHRLLAFSRQQALEPVLIWPGEVVEQMADLLQRTLGGRVRVQFTADEATWPVRADAAQLDACLFNLALNARDAMPSGGVLRLRVGNAGPHERLPADLPPGEYVSFVVKDEGAGMSPEALARAFEPFFTTKPVGKGTGLGLSMVQRFARQSGGDVRIESALGQGTTVSLWLPRVSQPEAAAPARADAEEAVEAGPARVLVVDDEPTVRETIAMFLTSAGLEPIPVASGAHALALLRAGEGCDLLVTDQSMPDMTGCELIDEVVQLRPTLPAILVTGYDKVSGLDQVEGRVTVLRKPFDRTALVRQAQALLGSAVLAAAVNAGTPALGLDHQVSNVVPFRAGPANSALA